LASATGHDHVCVPGLFFSLSDGKITHHLPIYLNKLGDMLFTMTDDSSPRVHLRLLLVAKKNAQHLHKKKIEQPNNNILFTS